MANNYQHLNRSELIAQIEALKIQLKQTKDETLNWKEAYQNQIHNKEIQLSTKATRQTMIRDYYEKQWSLINLTIYFKLKDLTNYFKIKFLPYYVLLREYKDKITMLTLIN